jgi:hypothetical protein
MDFQALHQVVHEVRDDFQMVNNDHPYHTEQLNMLTRLDKWVRTDSCLPVSVGCVHLIEEAEPDDSPLAGRAVHCTV